MMTLCHLRLATARCAFSVCWPYQSITSTSSVIEPFSFGVPSTLWMGTGLGRAQVSSLCFWTKIWLTNIPVAPESRRAEVEMECREVVVWSSTFMLRVHADLDRMYMDGGGTAGGSRGTGSCFTLGASLLSGVPRNGCDSVGYLQRECFLLGNWGTPLTSWRSKNPATPLPCFLQARHHQWPPLLSWHHLQQQSLWLLQLLGWSPETGGLCCTLTVHGVPDSSRQCALACYSCNRSEGGSWTSHNPSPWVVVQPAC